MCLSSVLKILLQYNIIQGLIENVKKFLNNTPTEYPKKHG